MIKSQSLLKIVDNSGAKNVKCIKVKNKSHHKAASLGDIIVVSIQTLKQQYKSSVKINKSEIYKAVVVQTKSFSKQIDGRLIRFGINSAVLINSKKKIIGTRISTVLPRQLRKSKWSKLGVLSKGFI
uniref:ribosomal protein L14 n=1 Tax=Dictyotopsis propagulifera TaxID=670095 RepID=UPI002E76289A|nr:ribosomal protein L14 [Dictyotopsis propagulifera]WBP69948.1 ribosomal protein L14 [Dictyotopsis propagulifera]